MVCGVWGNMFEPWGMQKSAVNTNSKIRTVSAPDRFQNVCVCVTHQTLGMFGEFRRVRSGAGRQVAFKSCSREVA